MIFSFFLIKNQARRCFGHAHKYSSIKSLFNQQAPLLAVIDAPKRNRSQIDIRLFFYFKAPAHKNGKLSKTCAYCELFMRLVWLLRGSRPVLSLQLWANYRAFSILLLKSALQRSRKTHSLHCDWNASVKLNEDIAFSLNDINDFFAVPGYCICEAMFVMHTNIVFICT